MTLKLGDWHDLKQCKHIVVASSSGYDPDVVKYLLEVSNMSELPTFPSEVGKIVSFFSMDGKTQICLLKINNEAKSQKNIEILRSLVQKIEGNETLGLCFGSESPHSLVDLSVAVSLTAYKVGIFKKEKSAQSRLHIIHGLQLDETLLDRAKNIANCMKFAMELVDLPPNIKTPDYAKDWVKNECEKRKLQCEVTSGEDLKNKGFGAITAVGQASKYGSHLLKISYFGRTSSTDIDLVLIGKGVTFDTGGISLKDHTNMHYMKSDLGGAAAVLGALFLTNDLGISANVTVIVPFVENAIDANSCRPGDVITGYGGQTIEIIDTDAEGRLILSDALAYAVKDIQADTIIDLATLTGNVVSALGYSAAGLFSNNEELSQQLKACGEATGERCWPLPLWEEYGEMMQSDIADIKNFHGRPIVGAITAAKFLEFFINDHPNWAHLDIAGVAFGDNTIAKSKLATGFGVRLLVEYIEKHIA